MLKQENIKYFSPEEEELVNLLITIGTKRNVAKVLAFLTRSPEATCHAVERGANLRQNQVSVVMRYLYMQGWIQSREHKTEGNGHRVKIYKLAKPVPEIIQLMNAEKEEEETKNEDDTLGWITLR